MFTYPEFIKPEAFSFGPLTVRWYALMYAVAYIVGIWLSKRRMKHGWFTVTKEDIDVWITYLIVGMILGARIFYVIFYNWEYYSINPQDILKVWRGGLSFHGAITGMFLSCMLFAKRRNIPVFMVTDTMTITGTIGLFFGRMGNFFNGELWGRVTDVPWAMKFREEGLYNPNLADPFMNVPARHPSQIYEAIGEGIIMFFVLIYLQKRWAAKNSYRYGYLGASFLIGYGFIRYLIEYVREPDAQLGLLFADQTMGQLLCLTMIVLGIIKFRYTQKYMPIAKAQGPGAPI